MMHNKEHCIETCNKLLRGERSAVETYDAAIKKYADNPAIAELRTLRDDHYQAVSKLEQNVLQMGGQPDRESGAWGTFAMAVQKSANLFGEESAIQSLIQGEKHGVSDYESALSDGEVLTSCKEMFRNDLLPKQHAHISTLERLQETV